MASEPTAPELVPDSEPMDGARLVHPGLRVWRGATYRHHKDAGGWLRTDEALVLDDPAPGPRGVTSLSPPAAFRDPSTAERIAWDGHRLTWPDGWGMWADGLPREDRLGRFWRVVGPVAMVTDAVEWRLARDVQ